MPRSNARKTSAEALLREKITHFHHPCYKSDHMPYQVKSRNTQKPKASFKSKADVDLRNGRSNGFQTTMMLNRRSGTHDDAHRRKVDYQSDEVINQSEGDISDVSEASSGSVDELLPSGRERTYSTLLGSLSVMREGDRPTKRRKLERHVSPVPARRQRESSPAFGSGLIDDEVGADNISSPEASEGDDTNRTTDPFVHHFDSGLTPGEEADLLEKVSMARQGKWRVEQVREGKQLFSLSLLRSESEEILIPGSFSGEQAQPCIKERLKGTLSSRLSHLEGSLDRLSTSIHSYQDAFFPCRNLQNADDLCQLACLHSLNHIFKTRDRIIKNNARLAKEDGTLNLELRDQGFTRPKVLIILPTRQSCVRYIESMMLLCRPEQQENKARFLDSFQGGTSDFSADKPPGFRELFAGNDDDLFRLGLKFTRKTVKFFSSFYNSDIIFASPLGLRMAFGSEDKKVQDHDFLSSIEVAIVDQADAIQMQNWEHVESIFAHLNLQPKEAHGCDFSRVRSWYLDGNARYMRQTIIFSALNFPALNRLYSQHMLNTSGKLKFGQMYDGEMSGLDLPFKQTFSRFDFASTGSEPDDRFNHFLATVMPSILQKRQFEEERGLGFLIFLPVYADFVRLRNHLDNSADTQSISFGSISEYSSVQDVTRARSHFISGRHSLLLYTERAHHFRRYKLKGVKRVMMYGLPENLEFYKEVVGGYLGASIATGKLGMQEASMSALFSRLDFLKLERICGSSRALSMVKEKAGDTFDFI